MRLLAERLATAGYSVEAPLLAGHGGSQEELAAVTWREWVASAQAALDALRARCAIVVLAGFSMGGAVALYLAARQEVAGIVTMSALIRVDNPLVVLLPIARHLMPYIYPLRTRHIDLTKPEVVERLRDYIPDLQVDPSKPEEIAAARRSIKVSIEAVYQLHTLLRHARADLPRVAAPALLIQAMRDEQVRPATVVKIYRALGSREKRIVRLTQSGHMMLAGPERQEVVAQVAHFMQEAAARAMV